MILFVNVITVLGVAVGVGGWAFASGEESEKRESTNV